MLLEKIARHRQCPLRDKALLLVLLSTRAKPLELAQLALGDYLDAAGQVRRTSVMRAEIAANDADRPLRHAMAAWKRKDCLEHFEDKLMAGMAERRYGQWQTANNVRHLVAKPLVDLSHLLGELDTRNRNFH